MTTKFLQRIIVTAFVFFAFSQCAITQEISDNSIADQIDTYLSRLEKFGFSGSALVAKNGNILYQDAYGVAWVPENIENHVNTLFSTGSVTKQFTAAAILYLEGEGKLSVDDNISRYFDSIPPDKANITIHQLLTHTSGFAPQYGDDYEPTTRDQLINKMLSMPLIYEPGQRYEYSNAGYSMLAAIVEVVSGMKYEEFLHQKLFRPLEMYSTGLQMLDVDDTLVAHSQNAQMGYPSPLERPAECWNLIGNGGILSTTGDMFKWYTALRSGRVLPKAETDKMFAPYVKEYPDAESYYGYGWVIQQSQRRDSRVIWHNGGAMPQGWSCAVYNYVNDSALFIVFSNKPIDGMLPVDNVALALSKILFKEQIDMPPEVIDIDQTEMEHVEGIYLLKNDDILRASLFTTGLHIYPIGQEAINALFPPPPGIDLSEFNNNTQKLLDALSQGDFITAAENWDIPPGEDGIGMLQNFWASFDSLGEFRNYNIIGTKLGEGAETFCRVNFDGGTENLTFVWMNGRCQGVDTGHKLHRVLMPLSKNSFAAYSLATGEILQADFTRDNKLVIISGKSSVQAERK
jgi:CubicO group peptidase (beta-lactamase class C family)